jgi:hypothetical protein
MLTVIETNKKMKKEILIALAGSVLLLAVYITQFKTISGSSPLVLLILAGAGLLLSLKYKLLGNALLLFSGLALVVHPFLFSSSYWLLPGAALVGYTGFVGLINWWKKDK